MRIISTTLLYTIENLKLKEVHYSFHILIRAMADDNASAEPATGDKHEQNLIPGDTPAQEGSSMGVSLIKLGIYLIAMLIQSYRSIVPRIGQLVSLTRSQSLFTVLKGCEASEPPSGVGLAMEFA